MSSTRETRSTDLDLAAWEWEAVEALAARDGCTPERWIRFAIQCRLVVEDRAGTLPVPVPPAPRAPSRPARSVRGGPNPNPRRGRRRWG